MVAIQPSLLFLYLDAVFGSESNAPQSFGPLGGNMYLFFWQLFSSDGSEQQTGSYVVMQIQLRMALLLNHTGSLHHLTKTLYL